MSAFLDLQNEIKNSVRLSSEDKATMLCLLTKTSEENIKTINELMAFVSHSVTSTLVSMLVEKHNTDRKSTRLNSSH